MQGKRFLRYCAEICALVVVSNLSGVASMNLVVETTPTIVRAAGDTITYNYHVVNDGDEVISDIHIRDSFENDISVETLKKEAAITTASFFNVFTLLSVFL